MRNAAARLRAAACASMAVATLLTVTPAAFAAPAAPPASVPAFTLPANNPPADSRPSRMAAAARVIALAKSHLGARWVWATSGPHTFDCSGLVLRAYSDAGLVKKLGGWGNRSGYAIYNYGRRHHLVSRTHGQPGDVVVWGGGGHVGIYLGNGMAISTLVSGVRIHGIYAVTKRFTAFVHTGLAGVKVGGLTKPVPKARFIGTRHAGASLRLRIGHAPDARMIATLRGGTRLTLFEIWHDPRGRTWYRVNANSHVGWVAGWLTRI